MNRGAKVVVVTGGSGCLGAAVSRRLAADGWQVVIVDQAKESGPSSLPEAIVFGGVDLSSEDSARKAIAGVVGQVGRIDALINVAGTFVWEPFESGGVETFDRLYTVNLRTAVLATQAAISHLLAQSSSAVVNVGAASAMYRAQTGLAAYAASKAGIAKLTEALADEFKDRGLRVNAVLPGIIDTPANRKAMPDGDFARWVAPEALADVVAFLLSNEARSVTGALLPVTNRM